MRKLILLVACTLPMTAMADVSSPKGVVEAFYAGMATGQQAKVEALMLPEVQIYESGYVERSRADYTAHHLPEDIAYAKTSKTKILKRDVAEMGDVAIVTSETETVDQAGKDAATYAGTETMVLKRVNSEWRIAHVHWSSHKLKR